MDCEYGYIERIEKNGVKMLRVHHEPKDYNDYDEPKWLKELEDEIKLIRDGNQRIINSYDKAQEEFERVESFKNNEIQKLEKENKDLKNKLRGAKILFGLSKVLKNE